MTPVKLNLVIYAGADFVQPMRWMAGKPPVAVDLTGATARMQVRETIDSDVVLLELSTANGGIVITPLEGRIELHVSAADTTALDWTKGVYDMEITHASGQRDRLLKGNVTVDPEVTR